MTFSCFTSTWAMPAMILMSGFFIAQAQAQLTVNTDDFHDKLLQLGTAPEGGSFEPVGNTLCDMLNEVRKKNLIRCVTKRTAGSVFNIHAVANESLQLGFSQEDLLAEGFF